MSKGRFVGKVAIVTGASINEFGLGIGGATAFRMADEGAKVVIGNRTGPTAEALAQEIRARGGEAVATALDLGDESSIRGLIDLAVDTFGTIDILVNNATAVPSEDTDLLNTSAETWDRVMAVNPRGVFLASKFALPYMLERGGGAIVNVSSGSGLLGDVTRIAYGSSKAAINTLTKYIATQYGKQNIRCNAITPGRVVKSDKKIPDSERHLFEKHTLTPYLGHPDHLAALIAFLASEEAAFINGAVIPADGGLLAHQTYSADLLELMQG